MSPMPISSPLQESNKNHLPWAHLAGIPFYCFGVCQRANPFTCLLLLSSGPLGPTEQWNSDRIPTHEKPFRKCVARFMGLIPTSSSSGGLVRPVHGPGKQMPSAGPDSFWRVATEKRRRGDSVWIVAWRQGPLSWNCITLADRPEMRSKFDFLLQHGDAFWWRNSKGLGWCLKREGG